MSFSGCVGEIQKAMGRNLSQKELDDLHEGLKSRQQERIRAGDDIDTATQAAAQQLAKDMERGALVKKRMAAFDAKTRLDAVDFIRTNFPDRPYDGLEALLVGINSNRVGTRDSAAAAQQQLKEKYGGGFAADLVKSGNLKLFTRGSMDREIARALYDLDLNPENLKAYPPEAVAIAKIIAKWQETTRLDANAAGADIAKLDGRITRQSHDIYKIRGAGYEAWKAEMRDRLDFARTFGDLPADKIEGALGRIYTDLASGVHLKAEDTANGFKGPLNLANRMGASRDLHFKSADDWFAYNEKFGVGTLREAVVRDLEMAGQNTGLLRRMGPNPGNNFNQIADEVTRGIKDPTQRAAFAKATGPGGYLRGRLEVIDGSASIPVNAMLARIGAGIRGFQNLSKLAFSIFSQANDVAIYGTALRYQGRGMLAGVGEALGNLVKGKGQVKFAEIDGPLGVYFESMRDGLGSRFSIAEDGVPGAITRMQRIFFRLNATRWWQDIHMAGVTRGMAHYVASIADTAHPELNPEWQRVLGLYNIDAPRWELLRQAQQTAVDGRTYITPEGVHAIPDEKFARVVKGNATAAKLSAAKDALAEQLRTLYNDQARSAMVGPDARTRAIMTQASRPGTPLGEFLRFVGQFKSFSLAMGYRVLGRELYGRGAGSLGEALKNGNGEMLGVANLVLWGTLFGYGSLALKSLARGQSPPPNSKETWAQSMAQGGGLGLYGDYLIGQLTSPTNTAQKTIGLLGPSASTAYDLTNVAVAAAKSVFTPSKSQRGNPVALAAVHAAINNMPNLFYTRSAFNYLIANRIVENLNPGAIRRAETNAKNQGQPFLLSPSAAIGR